MVLTAAHKRMQIARTTLLLDQPFFGVLALGLQLVEDASCPTAWTDGRSLGFNPAFVNSLTNDQLTALLAHEVMHCACGHPWRRGNRQPQKFNVATDYAINGVLQEAGFVLPPGGLINAQYHGRWAEWIYDRLPDDPQGNSGSGGNGQGAAAADPSGLGEVRDAPTDSDAPTEAEWQQQTQTAIKASKGKLPASLRRDIDRATAAHVDWRSLLRKYITEIARSDYSWTRPNVRYIPSGLYLPSLYSQDAGRMAVAVDTSGSIDSVLLQQFVGEISAIAQDVRPSSVDVIYCDAKVHRVDTFERGDSIVMHPCGGGGTDFRPVFDHLEHDPPAVLVYLTDLYGTFPPFAPDYPVIWAVSGSCDRAPFGPIVPLD